MSDRTPSPLVFTECAVDAHVPRAAARAYIALSAATGAAFTGLMLILSVAANSGGEAERIADTRDDGYFPTLVTALAVNFAKPLR